MPTLHPLLRWEEEGSSPRQACPGYGRCGSDHSGSAVAAQRDLCYTEHSASVCRRSRVRKRVRKEVQEKLQNGADRTTPSIALDFEENLMISILTSGLRIKTKRQKSTNPSPLTVR